MKNISTGFGLCVAAAAALAYPFVSSLAPSANASAVTAAAAAVNFAATAQAGPTVVWYGTAGDAGQASVFRAWSDGRVEVTRGSWRLDYCDGSFTTYGLVWKSGMSDGVYPLCNRWQVVSDPSQGLTYRSDINFDAKVDGADLSQLLTDWGDAPRQDILPSDCPLALINP